MKRSSDNALTENALALALALLTRCLPSPLSSPLPPLKVRTNRGSWKEAITRKAEAKMLPDEVVHVSSRYGSRSNKRPLTELAVDDRVAPDLIAKMRGALASGGSSGIAWEY